MRERIRRVDSRNLALLIASLVVSLLAAEIFVRLAVDVPVVDRIHLGENSAYRLSENPILGYEMKRSYVHEGPAHRSRIERTNSHGFRDVERAVRKPPGTRRIILLGDSVVAGHGIASLDDTISRQLEARFDASERIEVLNMGMGGYCTRAEVELLERYGLAFEPDLVILVFVRNDFRDRNSQLARIHYQRPEPINWLFLRSELFRTAALRFDWFRFRDEVDPEHRDRINEAAVGDGNVESGFRILKALAEEHDFKVGIAIWPAFKEKRILDEPFPADRFDVLIVEQIAAEIGLPAVRLSKRFGLDYHFRGSGDPDRSPQELYTTGDQMHPNALGAKVASGILLDLVRRNPAFQLERAAPTVAPIL